VTEGQIQCARALLDAKADIDAKAVSGETALTMACGAGEQEIVDLLLEAQNVGCPPYPHPSMERASGPSLFDMIIEGAEMEALEGTSPCVQQ